MDTLNAADWVIVSVIGISMAISLVRGFIKEALSLAGWVLAFIVSMVFSQSLASLLAGSIENDTGRHIVAFAVLFVGTLIVTGLLAKLLQSLVESAGLGGLDRLLGMAFGFARGVLVLLALVVMLRSPLGLDRLAWWQESVLMPHLLLMESWFWTVTGVLRGFIAG
jgi:membrane protein required for colicin V production